MNEEGEMPDARQVLINDEFYNKTVFERLGPKRIQLSSPASTNKHLKPPFSEQQAWRGDFTPTQEEYTHKVNSSSHVSNQLPGKVHPINQPRTSYSEIVKTQASRVVNKLSTKSTSDISKQVSTNMPHKESMSRSTSGSEQRQTKLPLKLVPVQPPQKNSGVNLTTTLVASTTTTRLPEKKIPKVKLKLNKRFVVQRRALSPMSEDSEPSEGREQIKNNVCVVDTVNQMLPLEEPMEFETIDEREFPILTEDLSTTFSQEGGTQLDADVVPNTYSQDVNSSVASTSASNEQTTLAKDAEVLVEQKTGAKNTVPINQSMNMIPTTEFSTPDRPSGPLLEEKFGTSEPASNKGLHQSIESVRAQLITSEKGTETKAYTNTAISTPMLNKELNLRVEPTAE